MAGYVLFFFLVLCDVRYLKLFLVISDHLVVVQCDHIYPGWVSSRHDQTSAAGSKYSLQPLQLRRR